MSSVERGEQSEKLRNRDRELNAQNRVDQLRCGCVS